MANALDPLLPGHEVLELAKEFPPCRHAVAQEPDQVIRQGIGQTGRRAQYEIPGGEAFVDPAELGPHIGQTFPISGLEIVEGKIGTEI